MRTKWVWALVIAVAAVAACGLGHAIFVVDAYSFMKGTGSETVNYPAVPPGTVSASNTPVRIRLPGAAASIVDSVTAFGTVELQNQAGTGTIGLQVYAAADSAGTYNSSALVLTVPTKAVSGSATVQDTIIGRLAPAADSLFRNDELWTRVQITVSNTGATLMQGKVVLKSLQATIVITDKIF